MKHINHDQSINKYNIPHTDTHTHTTPIRMAVIHSARHWVVQSAVRPGLLAFVTLVGIKSSWRAWDFQQKGSALPQPDMAVHVVAQPDMR